MGGSSDEKMAAAKSLRFGNHIKELRIHLCQKSPASQGVRDFIENSYVSLKSMNPKLPILIRECSGVQPRLWARYEMGKESSIPLPNFTGAQVQVALESISATN